MTKQEILSRCNGFLKGICHPGQNLDLVKAAGFGWVRWDVPFPYDKNGKKAPSFEHFIGRCKAFADIGIRTICVSPYPRDFLECGIDVRTEEGLATVSDICRRMAADMKDVVGCWQATNEMFVPAFRAPITEEEAVGFVAASIQGLRAAGTDALIGHNCYASGWEKYALAIDERSGGSDYAGVDLYAGTWGPGGVDSYIPELERVAALAGLPVILMEFGFASKGSSTDLYSNGQINWENPVLNSFLNRFSFKDAHEVLAEPDRFVRTVLDTCSPDMAKRARECSPSDKIPYIMQSVPHLLKSWPAKSDTEHTPQTQAEFYTRLLPRLMEHPQICGAAIYCMYDSDNCFTCGMEDCPCETAWGLVRHDGTPKPAYEAVAAVFNAR
ncbi:MAG: hypothetical protein IJR83_03940 [Clostridia bacterium]|nr:hypothetical protein [Clostridia bacterium]